MHSFVKTCQSLWKKVNIQSRYPIPVKNIPKKMKRNSRNEFKKILSCYIRNEYNEYNE